MSSAIFELSDEYINRSAALLPLHALYWGVPGHEGKPSDLSPVGEQARAELRGETLKRLDQLVPEGRADELAALHLRERLSAEQAGYELGEYQREVVAGYGVLRSVRNSPELLPRDSAGQWEIVAATLRSLPETLASWRASLQAGVGEGRVAARRQALGMARQAAQYADDPYRELVSAYGTGPLALELGALGHRAAAAFGEIATYLRDEYAPVASEVDGVGLDRYLVAARLKLGARIDPRDAYDWAWDELRRIETEMVREAATVGGSVPDAVALLDRSDCVDGEAAYLEWLQRKHDEAIAALDGTHFDIDPAIRTVTARLVPEGSAAYYVGPSEDLSRPGITWWPVNGRSRFEVWHELTTVFHEGVPGHHLQIGNFRASGAALSRFARLSAVSGNLEGWALYAERLSDELGWFDTPGRRLGMLMGSALRAARVVIDIGVHVGLPIPAREAELYGPQWTFENTLEVLARRAFLAGHRQYGEAMRYFGWPAQASCYKLGERAWLAAREAARQRPGFDLKSWHTAALDLGPLGLDNLTAALNGQPRN